MEYKNRTNLPHLFLKGTSKTERYTSPLSIRHSIRFPARDRQSHAAFLVGQIESIRKEDDLLKKEKIAYGVDAGNGICLQFKSAPEFPLKIESNVSDQKGHGTEMAGLALYGGLTPVLLSRDSLVIPHVLESVKILPPIGQNDPELYGHVTAESIARAEISAPQRKRCICLAITTTDFRDRGKSSSWSAAIDSLNVA